MSDSINARDVDLGNLHPLMRLPVFNMMHELNYATGRPSWAPEFGIFEGYRGADRQAYLLKRGDSKARPWTSAHQYGLAVDVVPKRASAWTWDVGGDVWAYLATIAVRNGLVVPIGWDKAHVEHPEFGRAKSFIRTSR